MDAITEGREAAQSYNDGEQGFDNANRTNAYVCDGSGGSFGLPSLPAGATQGVALMQDHNFSGSHEPFSWGRKPLPTFTLAQPRSTRASLLLGAAKAAVTAPLRP